MNINFYFSKGKVDFRQKIPRIDISRIETSKNRMK